MLAPLRSVVRSIFGDVVDDKALTPALCVTAKLLRPVRSSASTRVNYCRSGGKRLDSIGMSAGRPLWPRMPTSTAWCPLH